MSEGPELETGRLILRRWREGDLDLFAALNSDGEVMEHMVSTLSTDETAAMIERIEAHFEANGFGLWAVELALTGEFVGFAGLSIPRFEAHFTPAVEVGWRLSRSHWGKGYATEAAAAAMEFGFNQAELDEIVSFAVPANTRSTRVMERLGMTRDPADDFDHPVVSEPSPLQRHVLYRISRERWSAMNPGRTR
jgi:ribosomal-protein-alanine N-acetyltransferase